MNDLWNLLPPSGWQRLAADIAWQGSLIIACGLLTARLVARRPAARAAILLAAVMLSLAVPLGSAAVRLADVGLLAPPARLAHRPIDDRTRATLPVAGQSVAWDRSPARAARPAEPQPARHPAFWLLAGWLAASSLLTVRLLRGLWTVRCWIERAEPCGDPRLAAAMERAAAATGVGRVPLLRTAELTSPALVALGRPKLLVPMGMPERTDWFAVFCHELAHRARRDILGRAAIELAVASLPWQPLLWFARSGFRIASEEACDDWAVAAGADPIELASLLVELVPQRGGAFALAMADGPKATRRRILRLLDLGGKIRPRLGWMACACGAAVAIGLGTGLALLQWRGSPAIVSKSPVALAKPRIAPWQAGAPTEKDKSTLPTYIIEAPDILLIAAVHAVAKPSYRLERGDTLEIESVEPAIKGEFAIDVDGQLFLGSAHESLPVAGLTLAEARKKLTALVAKTTPDPRLSMTLSLEPILRQISGQRPVGPDGTIQLGPYGAVQVAGLTLSEAKQSIEAQLAEYLDEPRVGLDVFSNSKVYYIITEGEGVGDSLVRIPITGNETVLDALAQVDGLSRLPDKKIWIARPTAGALEQDMILPVNWSQVVRGATATNYQVFPGDRIFIVSKKPGPAQVLVSSVARAFRALAEAATEVEEFVDDPPAVDAAY